MTVILGAPDYKKTHEVLKCRNYGCQQKYTCIENHNLACHFHTKPPTFHDTKKGWGCCNSRMVYDWDDFEKITKCQVGAHNCIDPNERIVTEPVTAASLQQVLTAPTTPSVTTPVAAPVAAPVVVLKSIDDFNTQNPTAVTAASAVIAKAKK